MAYYPRLQDLISAADLPAELGFLQDATSMFAGSLFYSQYSTASNSSGTARYYNITLVSYEPIKLEFVQGTGFALVVNPGTGGTSEFPIRFSYEWELLRFLKTINTQNFGGTDREYFDLLFELAGISWPEFLDGFFKSIIGGSTPINDFITFYNGSSYNGSLSSTPVFDDDPVTDTLLQILDLEENIHDIIFDNYINVGTATQIQQNLKTLFDTWFGDLDLGDVLTKVLIPRISAEIPNLTLALEFPRDISGIPFLIPLLNGEPDPDPLVKSQLSFDVGSLAFSTEDGFSFDAASNFSFTESSIGGTGLTLDITGGSLDISKTSNITEADNDGRSNDFVGVFIASATLGLPQAWTGNTTGSIEATNLLIGSEGGLTGSFDLIGGPLDFSAYGLDFKITNFDIDFAQNAMSINDFDATVGFPFLTDGSGNPAEIGITVSWDNTNNLFQAQLDTGNLPSLIKLEGFEVSVDSLSFDFVGSTLTNFSCSLFIEMESFKDAPGSNQSNAQIAVDVVYSQSGFQVSLNGNATVYFFDQKLTITNLLVALDSGFQVTSFGLEGILEVAMVKNGSGNPQPIDITIGYSSGTYSLGLVGGNIFSLSLFDMDLILTSLTAEFTSTSLNSFDLGATLLIEHVKDSANTSPEPLYINIDYDGTTYGINFTGSALSGLNILGMELDITQLQGSFTHTALTSFAVTGTLRIPQLKNPGQSTLAPIGISLSYNSTEFSVSATNIPAIELGSFTVAASSVGFTFTKSGGLTGFTLIGTVTHDSFVDDQGNQVLAGFTTTYISGTYTFSVDAVNVDFQGIPVSLNAFSISFDSSGISAILISGTMTLQNVEDNSGNTDISITLYINGADFYLEAGTSQGLELTIPGFVNFKLYKLKIGKESGLWYLAFGTPPGTPGTYGALIEVLLDIPVLSKFIPEEIGINSLRINSNATTQDEMFYMKWEALNGMEVTASNNVLDVVIPLQLSILGVLDILGIRLRLDSSTTPSELMLLMSGNLALGPLTGSVKDVGVKVTMESSGGNGNLGPIDIGNFEIVPPSGMGMSLEAPGFSGGGYFEYSENEYAGAMEITIYELISVKAMGILTTQLPDGEKGFSLIIIITAEFQPIQLGFGFTLNGLGGLLGLNRTMMLEEMRTGVRDNSLDGILFPDNPVENAPKIISDMRVIFPVEKGQFVFGPMAILAWGTPSIVTAELGVAVEVPNPFRVAILGVVKMIFPDEIAPVLQLQVNFLGTFDSEAQLITFDASLYDSRLNLMTLEGDMAFRLGWGDNATFLFSAGGFHPAFVPPPLGLSDMKRLRVTIVDISDLKITIDSYFAVTSNTVQFGARADLYAKAIGFVAEAYIGFDVLFQFSPFYFIANVFGGADISFQGKSLFNVSLDFVLEGPEPYLAKGYAGFKFLGVQKDFRIEETWGETKEEIYPKIDLTEEVRKDLEKTDRWESLVDQVDGRIVYVKAIPNVSDQVVMDPAGELTVRQKIVPLGIPIEKFGNQLPNYNTTYQLIAEVGGTVLQEDELENVKDQFAPAIYKEVPDSMKLSLPSFTELRSGFTLKPGGDSDFEYGNHYTYRQIEYETVHIDLNENNVVLTTYAADEYKNFELVGAPFKEALDSTDPDTNRYFQYNLRGSSAALSDAGRSKKRYDTDFLASQKVTLGEEGYVVAKEEDLTAYDANSFAPSFSEANAYMESLLAGDPLLEGTILVIPEYAYQV